MSIFFYMCIYMHVQTFCNIVKPVWGWVQPAYAAPSSWHRYMKGFLLQSGGNNEQAKGSFWS